MGAIVDPRKIYTFEQMKVDIDCLCIKYPYLAKEIIGYSVEKRELFAIKLGTGSKNVLLNGAHHAREWLTTALLMNMIEYYCELVQLKADFRKLLQDVSIWFIPMVNPDGVTLVQTGSNLPFLRTLNNESDDFRAWKANIRGVDLNRQYPVDWESIDDQMKKPAPAMYKGAQPLSEPEVKALYQFVLEKDFCNAACYHSSGEEIFWKYKITGELLNQAKGLANDLAELTGYQLVEPDGEPSGGGFTDWFLMQMERPSFTIEIAPYIGPRPVPITYFDQIWEQNKEVGIFLAEACLGT
ncbi:M14 family metallopeptidase [Gracilibacillus dipsosauri]|uniref:M14 family metallopeptidase n=1 Tax=Gracilibacillus dipsosauri TaxID=178340 RepID=UPI00240A27E2